MTRPPPGYHHVVQLWNGQRWRAELGLSGAHLQHPEIGLEPSGRRLAADVVVARTGRFLRDAGAVTRESVLDGLAGRPALPAAVTAQAARGVLVRLCADNASWYGLRPEQFASPLLHPSDTSLVLLSVGERRRSDPWQPGQTPPVFLGVASAAVLTGPDRLHVHAVAGAEPLSAVAMTMRAALTDAAAIVSVFPSRAPGGEYGEAEFTDDVINMLAAVYLRHGRVTDRGDPASNPVTLTVSGDDTTAPVLDGCLPVLNQYARDQGYVSAERIDLPDELARPVIGPVRPRTLPRPPGPRGAQTGRPDTDGPPHGRGPGGGPTTGRSPRT